MGWPEYTFLALTFVGLGIDVAKHGEPKGGRHDAIVSTISTAILLGILWAGGFF